MALDRVRMIHISLSLCSTTGLWVMCVSSTSCLLAFGRRDIAH